MRVYCCVFNFFFFFFNLYQQDLRDVIGVPFNVSEPIINIKETVIHQSSMTCMAASPNKRNCIFAKAYPIPEHEMRQVYYIIYCKVLIADFTTQKISPIKRLSTLIAQGAYKWDDVQDGKIWAYSTENEEANILSSHIDPQVRVVFKC